MEIILQDVAKHFGPAGSEREVVLQGLTLTFPPGSRTAVLGPNGSGKSTLLQLVGGVTAPTHGRIEHRMGGGTVRQEDLYRHVGIAAPYLGLYEDLTMREAVSFHARFKSLLDGIGTEDMANIASLGHALEKPVLHFSSGMKQRLKLSLAILSDTPLLLLDEPASNLDAGAVSWFRDLLARHVGDRTLIIASNRQPAEHNLCTNVVEVERWKSRDGN